MDSRNIEILVALLMMAALLNIVPVHNTPVSADTDKMDEALLSKRDAHSLEWGKASTKYIMDIYNNNSAINRSSSKVNTIKSLTFNPRDVPICGHYNFTLSAINATREDVLQSELHLYIKMPFDAENSYLVKISAKLSNGSTEPVVRDLELVESKYYIFPVQELVQAVLSEGETFAVFEVAFYKKYHPLDAVNCSTIEHAYEDAPADYCPLLIVQSYDTKLDNMDFSSAMNLTQLTPESSSPPPSHPVKRSTPACQVHEFDVSTDFMFYFIDDSYSSATIIAPLWVDVGICGGACLSGLPHPAETHIQHINAVIDYGMARTWYPEYHFVKTCAPMTFQDLSLILITQEATQIVVIPDMIVDRCNCIDILGF